MHWSSETVFDIFDSICHGKQNSIWDTLGGKALTWMSLTMDVDVAYYANATNKVETF